jgi:hypothetical protein
VRQFQILPQPVPFLLRPRFDFNKGVCAGQHRGHGNHQHFNQIMLDFPGLPRVAHADPHFGQSDLLFRLHGNAPKRQKTTQIKGL